MIIILYKLLVNKPTPVLLVTFEIQLAHCFFIWKGHHTNVRDANVELVEFLYWFTEDITVHFL